MAVWLEFCISDDDMRRLWDAKSNDESATQLTANEYAAQLLSDYLKNIHENINR